ncbi:hypothetical protein ABVF61_05390 [Roseibium sp. HPY-6]|uniref:hypothetical protein n=1 Tax=Roseibium sp. HPY-6 TaxID=3229852 RepID=UPI00338DD5ED
MADFEDITGWREELRDHFEEFGQEGIDYLYRNSIEIIEQEVSISQVQDYADLLMKHKETRDALLVFAEWQKVKLAHPGGIVEPGDPAYKDRPKEIIYLLADFYEWYCMKTDFPCLKNRVSRWGKKLAIGVLQGEIASTRSKEFADQYKETVEFDASFSEKHR